MGDYTLPPQPLWVFINDKPYLPDPDKPGSYVPASPEAAAVTVALDRELGQLRAIVRQMGVEP